MACYTIFLNEMTLDVPDDLKVYDFIEQLKNEMNIYMAGPQDRTNPADAAEGSSRQGKQKWSTNLEHPYTNSYNESKVRAEVDKVDEIYKDAGLTTHEKNMLARKQFNNGEPSYSTNSDDRNLQTLILDSN